MREKRGPRWLLSLEGSNIPPTMRSTLSGDPNRRKEKGDVFVSMSESL